jgi:hypothetical protein
VRSTSKLAVARQGRSAHTQGEVVNVEDMVTVEVVLEGVKA